MLRRPRSVQRWAQEALRIPRTRRRSKSRTFESRPGGRRRFGSLLRLKGMYSATTAKTAAVHAVMVVGVVVAVWMPLNG